MKQIEKLDWDSDFFKIRVGKFLIVNEEEFDPIVFKKEAEQKFDLIYVLSYQKMLSQEKINLANLDLPV